MKKILFVVMVLVFISSFAFAQDKPKMDKEHDCKDCQKHGKMMVMEKEMHAPMKCMEMHQMMMEKLKLNAEQKKKLETLKTEHQKKLNLLKAELQNLNIDRQNALKADEFKKAKALNKEISVKKLAIADGLIDHIEAVLKELNPEQKEKARGMMQKMKMQMKEIGCMDGKDKCGEGKGHCK